MTSHESAAGHKRRETLLGRLEQRAAAVVLVVVVIVVLVAGAVSADTVMKLDGTMYTGRILRESPAMVTMEIQKHGAKLLVKIPRSQIRSILRGEATDPAADPSAGEPATAPADADAPGYYPLPIISWMGADTRSEDFAEALKDAQSMQPHVLLIYINSPGGLVKEVDGVLNLLAKAKSKSKDLRVVAYVRKAHGAAAALALSFKQLYMDPIGTICAIGDDDPPEQAREHQGRINAKIRHAARAGGHSPLIARALTDRESELFVDTVSGKPVAKPGENTRLLKTEGETLVLTGRMAADCGVAIAATEDMSSLYKHMGLKPWRRLKGIGWSLLRGKATARQKQREEAKMQQRRKEYEQKRQEYMRQIEPDLNRIQAEIDHLKQAGVAVAARKQKLMDDYNEQVARAQRAYRDRIRRLDPDATSYYTEKLRAKAALDRQLEEIKERNKPRAEKIQAQITQLQDQMKALRAERKKLLDGGPKFDASAAD